MTITLLVDLDGTLLDNDIDNFLVIYTRALAGHMLAYAEPSALVAALMAGTQKMMENQLPDRTLKQVFDEVFYPSLNVEEEAVRGAIDGFYSQVFPTLQGATRVRPEAVAMVEEARRRGYRVAVATNPLFPRAAILQRLAWAGLPVDRYPFELVPSYETFHFAKPNPAFFAEFLARLGYPEGPVIMVGNDLWHDIAAAQHMGLATYWVPSANAQMPDDFQPPTGQGSLADLLPWLDNQPQESLLPNYRLPLALLSILQATPATLRRLQEEVPATDWNQKIKLDEWSLTEIACHLRDVDHEVNLPRMQKIMEEPNPFLPGMDTDPWAQQRNYNQQDCGDAVNTFVINRCLLVNLLSRLKPEDWERPARHAIFGPTQLGEIVSIIAEHDRLHIQQIRKVLNELKA